MYCKKCGAALPSRGFVCRSCGVMMDSEQIKMQKEHIKNEENKRIEINLLSDKYSSEPINRDYKKNKESKVIGVIFVLIVLVLLIIFALLKVM